jgi:type I restriction enzyme M protein
MATTRLGFLRASNDISAGIFIPKYYDPSILNTFRKLESTHDLISMAELIDSGEITVHHGHDIGKHYYGLGDIPYVRTSDLATWEIVSAQQTVGEEAYDIYAERQDNRAGDVLFVRDGLYLIGRVALVTQRDLPLIHQSHLIRFRCAEGARVAAPLLLAVLSTPLVIRQVRSKQFTAGIIDKIEDRYLELMLPIPKSAEVREAIAQTVQDIVDERARLRDRARQIPLEIEGVEAVKEDYEAEDDLSL